MRVTDGDRRSISISERVNRLNADTSAQAQASDRVVSPLTPFVASATAFARSYSGGEWRRGCAGFVSSAIDAIESGLLQVKIYFRQHDRAR